MGNFSVNHYSNITLANDRIRIRYFIDLAEIPAYQELQEANISATGADPKSNEVITYLAARGAELGRGLILEVEGKAVPLRLISSDVIFPPGAGGLPTMKMGFVYSAAYPSDHQGAVFSMPTTIFPAMLDGKRLSPSPIRLQVSSAAPCPSGP